VERAEATEVDLGPGGILRGFNANRFALLGGVRKKPLFRALVVGTTYLRAVVTLVTRHGVLSKLGLSLVEVVVRIEGVESCGSFTTKLVKHSFALFLVLPRLLWHFEQFTYVRLARRKLVLLKRNLEKVVEVAGTLVVGEFFP
jgi:hypothetical protein